MTMIGWITFVLVFQQFSINIATVFINGAIRISPIPLDFVNVSVQRLSKRTVHLEAQHPDRNGVTLQKQP